MTLVRIMFGSQLPLRFVVTRAMLLAILAACGALPTTVQLRWGKALLQ